MTCCHRKLDWESGRSNSVTEVKKTKKEGSFVVIVAVVYVVSIDKKNNSWFFSTLPKNQT